MLFLQNKYTSWYFSIINKAKERATEGYTEKHHIVPKTLGGKNDKSTPSTLIPNNAATETGITIETITINFLNLAICASFFNVVFII